MHKHRIAVDYGDQLHFEPAYTMRFLVAWVVVVGWVVLVVLTFLEPELFRFGRLDPGLFRHIVEFGSVIVLGGTGVYLRGQYLCLDKRQGKILKASGFSGAVFGWQSAGEFALDGTMRFQYCQAEFQSLCVVSYQQPGKTDWLVMLVYTDPKVAAEVATELRRWAPTLIVNEEHDQSALDTARTIKPLAS